MKPLSHKKEEELTDWAKEELRKSAEDTKNGYISPSFTNVEDSIAWLEDPNAIYINGRRKNEI